MPLPRFRLRTLMIAVALVALALAGFPFALSIRRRAIKAQEMASDHAILARICRESSQTWARVARDEIAGTLKPARRMADYAKGMAEDDARAAGFHDMMAQKYRVAASRPWLPLPTYPPPIK